MADHGVQYRTRREHARETVLAMKALWEQEEAGFDGEYISFSPSWSWPKPAQRPLPLLLGGSGGPKLFAHIAEYADGWIPIGGSGLGKALPQLRDAVAATGRDPSTLEIVPFGSLPDPGKLDYFTTLGVTECVFRLPSQSREIVLPILDEQAKLVAAQKA